jgi:exodeoxyribonuclease V
MKWTNQQDAALKAVSGWIKRPKQPVFRLFGYAGSGKTTLAQHLAEGMDGTVAFAAFTGKAALVMKQKGCTDASTIHALIYRGDVADKDGTLSFAINRSGPASKADLIIIDECSMVDEELGRDLLSFGKPVLVLGDPAQLPPVKGGGYFTDHPPDIMLTEVHRQAQDNPIIRLSMQVRDGGTLDYGEYGKVRVIRRNDMNADIVLHANQVLVGTNKNRSAYNRRIRDLKGYMQSTPSVGEKLVCLRNDKLRGLLNGGLWTVKKLRTPKGDAVRFDLVPEEDPSRSAVTAVVRREAFEGTLDALPYAARRDYDEFDYGYTLTVHKSQGSQWDRVVLFDESFAFRENRTQWLYTGITRAAEELVVVR